MTSIQDNWISLDHEVKRHYIKFCKLCKGEINITQSGEKLSQEILDYVVEIGHIENHFDNYYEHKYEKNKYIKIDIEIKHDYCKN